MIKNCLVFGGSAGIGKSCAKKLLEEGNNVFIFSRSKKNLIKTQNELSKFKSKIFIFDGDIGKKNHTDKFIEAVKKKFKEIHVVIFSSGGPQLGNFDKIKKKNMDRKF